MPVKRFWGLGLLAAALALLASCAGRPVPTAPDGALAITPLIQYQMAEVRTSTPVPSPAPPTPRPTATFVPLPTPWPSPSQPNRASVPRVDVGPAWDLAKSGEALLVDVRAQGVYERQHIAGAISLPLDEVAQRYAELPTDRLLIFYCD